MDLQLHPTEFLESLSIVSVDKKYKIFSSSTIMPTLCKTIFVICVYYFLYAVHRYILNGVNGFLFSGLWRSMMLKTMFRVKRHVNVLDWRASMNSSYCLPNRMDTENMKVGPQGIARNLYKKGILLIIKIFLTFVVCQSALNCSLFSYNVVVIQCCTLRCYIIFFCSCYLIANFKIC